MEGWLLPQHIPEPGCASGSLDGAGHSGKSGCPLMGGHTPSPNRSRDSTFKAQRIHTSKNEYESESESVCDCECMLVFVL